MSDNIQFNSFGVLLLISLGVGLVAFLVWLLLARSQSNAAARAMKIIGRCIKYTAYAIVIGINAILIWRMLSMGDPSSMETLMVSDRTASLWQQTGEQLEIITQRHDPLTEDGKFAQSNFRYLPEIDQLQVTARYNNSTIRALAEDLALVEVPPRSSDLFDITLVKVITPDEEEQKRQEDELLSSDALGEEESETPRKETRYFPAARLDAKKTVYNYRRLLFEDVTLDDAEALYLEFYYKNAVNYDTEPYGSLLIWSSKSSDRPYELTKKDISALKKGAVSYD